MVLLAKISNLFKWRDLAMGLAGKDLKNKYRNANGGFGWMIISPLAQMVIFSLVFGSIFKINIANYHFFLLCGLLPWGFLRSVSDSALNSILSNRSIIKKTSFPREVLPISSVLSNFVPFMVSLIFLFLLSLFITHPLGDDLLWLPVIVLFQLILLAGFSLIVAGLNAVYRETQFVVEIVLLVWFYLTPIVYSLDIARDALAPNNFILLSFNPMTGIITGYQDIFFYGRSPELGFIFGSFLSSTFIFFLGWFIFWRCEKRFEDIL